MLSIIQLCGGHCVHVQKCFVGCHTFVWTLLDSVLVKGCGYLIEFVVQVVESLSVLDSVQTRTGTVGLSILCNGFQSFYDTSNILCDSNNFL